MISRLTGLACLCLLTTSQAFAVTGVWHLQWFEQGGDRILANDYRNEALLLTPSSNGGLEISNRRVGQPMPFVEQRRSGNVVFYTAGLQQQPDQYRFSHYPDGRLLLNWSGPTMEFRQQQPRLAPLLPVKASDEHITLTEPWARQYWFVTFNDNFAKKFGQRFEACFSDVTCRQSCDATNVCKNTLIDDLVQMIDASRKQDNLFTDNIAAGRVYDLAWYRKLLLDLQAQMHRRKNQSLLLTKDITLDLLTKLIEDGSPPVAKPADDDAYFNAQLEVIGCTAVGFIPGIGDALTLGCGARGLSTLQRADINLSNSDTESLSSLFGKISDKQDATHQRVYHQWDSKIQQSLKRETNKDTLYQLYTDMQKQFDGLPLPTREQVVDSIFDAVWPYAFFILGKGQKTELDLDVGEGLFCQLLLKPNQSNPLTRAFESVLTQSVVADGSSHWALSLHESFTGSSFFYKRYEKGHATLVSWTLNIGRPDNYSPIAKAARDEFDAYVRRQSPQVFTTLLDSERIYFASPYGVRRHIAPQIGHENKNFVEYDPDNPGMMAWPPSDKRTLPLDNVGYIRDSILGRPGRVAFPPLRCMRWN